MKVYAKYSKTNFYSNVIGRIFQAEEFLSRIFESACMRITFFFYTFFFARSFSRCIHFKLVFECPAYCSFTRGIYSFNASLLYFILYNYIISSILKMGQLLQHIWGIWAKPLSKEKEGSFGLVSLKVFLLTRIVSYPHRNNCGNILIYYDCNRVKSVVLKA